MSDDPAVNEILERVRRLESRTVRLGDHVGIDLRGNPHVTINEGDPVTVTIESTDVSVCRIITILAAHDAAYGEVHVRQMGSSQPLFTIHLPNRT